MATRNNYDYPTDASMVDENGRITVSWGQWVQRTHVAASSVQNSGPTSERPIKTLWIGRQYFDTTLGHPVWIQSVPPAPASAVWVDATGTPV